MGSIATPGGAAVDSVIFPNSWIDNWLAAATADQEFRTLGRWTTLSLVLRCAEAEIIVDIDGGRIYRRVSGAAADPADTELIILDGSAAAWASLLTPKPAPRHNDVLALDRHHSEFDVVAGRTSLIRHLRIVLLLMSIAAQTEGRSR
jgi:hypothetical protein